MKKISIIGSGFSGLAAACIMAKQGHNVTVFEKNSSLGGRARSFAEAGFTFDMGPSWYWMPDVFERFFMQFNKKPQDYYNLSRLDPGFQIIFNKGESMQLPASLEKIYEVFESIEKGSAEKLKKFLKEGAFKYNIGMKQLVYKPSFSWLEFANYETLSNALKLNMFKSVSQHVHSYFKDERLIALMEFPVLFLGAMAHNIPSLYTLMNYAALSLGTWYPHGGMIEIVKAMESLTCSMNVKFETNCEVTRINTKNRKAHQLLSSKGAFDTDGIIATGDYHHIDQNLLEEKNRNYTEKYWAKKIFAPSCLIFYLGVNKKINNLIHHNLFFDASITRHSEDIYKQPQWPEEPLFYVCCPSKTDSSVAPASMENLFLLIPIATGLEDTEDIREKYFKKIITRLEQHCKESIIPHIIYKKSYCVNDFMKDYNAYKGNAYGLANTLKQTAVLKPSMRNNKVENMFYAGQLTVPGPGVPPALISGQIAAEQLLKYFK